MKNNLVKQVFTALHQVPEMDLFIEKGQEYFKKKYGIDYFSVHMVHHSRSCLVGRYDHEKWHEFLYKYHYGMNHPNLIDLSHKMHKDQLYLEYFDTVMPTRDLNIRAEIVGARKHGGCGIIITDDNRNITVYDITFKNDAAFSTLDKKILHNLLQDLIDYRHLLLPFINHGDQFGDFSDKHILHRSINDFMSLNPSLFNF